MTTLAEALRTTIRTVPELRAYLAERGIEPSPAIFARLAEPRTLPIRVPRSYLDLVDWSDPDDPILAQVLPVVAEHDVLPDELVDPIGDDAHSPVPGIVHRYPDRVLFLITMSCVVHCRFCFRREFVDTPVRRLRKHDYEVALQYIAEHEEIWEVILSGGDPLALPDAALRTLFQRLRAIPHVKVLRIHTRVPAVFPERLTDEFAQMMRSFRPLYVVVHVNHPREVTRRFREGVEYLVDRGISVLSQTVLLRGVNDSPSTLADLFRRLVEIQVKPYYLHQLDRAPGTHHFRVPIREGREIVSALRGNVSGLCLPTYMLDIPGGYGKVPLPSTLVEPVAEDAYAVVNFRGERLTVHDAERMPSGAAAKRRG